MMHVYFRVVYFIIIMAYPTPLSKSVIQKLVKDTA